MPEYNNTIRLGYRSVEKLRKAIREMSSNAGKPFAAAWIRLATEAGEAQQAGIHKAISSRQYEVLETICSCGLIAKDTPLEQAEGHLDRDGRVLDVIVLEVKPGSYQVACTECSANSKTHKPINTDDALVTGLGLRHRRGCVAR
jgi:hypothetical protein